MRWVWGWRHTVLSAQPGGCCPGLPGPSSWEQGELTEGREAAFNLLTEAPSYANTGKPPRLITPVCIPGRVIPTCLLPKQPAIVFISTTARQGCRAGHQPVEPGGLESPRAQATWCDACSNMTAEARQYPAQTS